MTKTEDQGLPERLAGRDYPMRSPSGEQETARLFWACTCDDWAMQEEPCMHVVIALGRLERDSLDALLDGDTEGPASSEQEG